MTAILSKIISSRTAREINAVTYDHLREINKSSVLQYYERLVRQRIKTAKR